MAGMFELSKMKTRASGQNHSSRRDGDGGLAMFFRHPGYAGMGHITAMCPAPAADTAAGSVPSQDQGTGLSAPVPS